MGAIWQEIVDDHDCDACLRDVCCAMHRWWFRRGRRQQSARSAKLTDRQSQIVRSTNNIGVKGPTDSVFSCALLLYRVELDDDSFFFRFLADEN